MSKDDRFVYSIDEFWGRGYSVSGKFMASEAEVKAAVGRFVNFGEICGKHSEVCLTIKPDTIKLVTDNPSEIALLQRLGCLVGQDPIERLIEDDEEGEYLAAVAAIKQAIPDLQDVFIF